MDYRIKLSTQMMNDFNDIEGNLDVKDGINCTHCKNKGLIQKLDERNFAVTYDCPYCKTKRKVSKTIKEQGLENLFKKYTMDNYLPNYKNGGEWQSRVKDRALEYLKDGINVNGYWFTILGQSGSGKTHISTAISKELVEQGYDYEWLTFTSRLPFLFKELNSGFIDVKEKAEKQWDRIKKVKILYIDDLFKGSFDNNMLTLIFELINHRYYDSNLITIISSEKSQQELRQYDEAIAGRIKERSKDGYYLINLVGNDKNLREG